MDLLSGGPEGYTTQKLIRDLKRLPNSPIIGISTPIEVKRDVYTNERTKAKFWMISTRWLEAQGIEVKVQVPTLKFEEAKPIVQEDSKEEENLASMERMILEMSRDPIDLNVLIERVTNIFKVSEEEVMGVITSLMARDLLKMEEGAKVRRALND